METFLFLDESWIKNSYNTFHHKETKDMKNYTKSYMELALLYTSLCL